MDPETIFFLALANVTTPPEIGPEGEVLALLRSMSLPEQRWRILPSCGPERVMRFEGLQGDRKIQISVDPHITTLPPTETDDPIVALAAFVSSEGYGAIERLADAPPRWRITKPVKSFLLSAIHQLDQGEI